MQSDALDNAIAALDQKIQNVEAGISKAEVKAEKAEAEGNTEDLKYWRNEKQQLRDEKQLLMEEKKQLRDEKARKEVLQQAGPLTDRSVLVAAKKVKSHTSGRPFFLEGQPLDPLGQGFVETETEQQLASNILGGAWCLLLGHRQSGKSTTVVAAQEILSASEQRIQLEHISLEDEFDSSEEFWCYLADRLHGVDPQRFPLADPAQLAANPSKLMWEWFRPGEGKTAIAIAIDEAALLVSIQDIGKVMAKFRAFRDARNRSQLRSVVLVGTEAVARLMEAANSNASAGNYSSFSWNIEMTPAPFTEAQTNQLLSEYAELRKVQLAPSSDDWAADIWQRTRGHRGLTSLCGAQLEGLLFRSGQARKGPVHIDKWLKYARTELPDALRKRATVSRMLMELQRRLQALDGREEILELLEMVLLKPACLVPRSHPAVELLLELGFARIVPQLASTGPRQSATAWPEGAAYLDCLITVTAPIITAITLAEAAYEIQSDLLAPRPLDDREFGIWLLCSALQFADAEVLDAPEVQLRDKRRADQSSEYIWQAQFWALVKAVLKTQHDLSTNHTWLAEVKVGKSKERLDFLLRNRKLKLGFELTIKASKATMEKYVERCEAYADMHEAHIFAVNIVRTSEVDTPPLLPDLPNSSDKVTPVNVLVDTVQRRISVKQRASDAQYPWLGPKKASRLRFPGILRASLKLPIIQLPKMLNVKWLCL